MAAPAAMIRPASGVRVGGALGTIYLVWGSTYLAIAVMIDTLPPLLGAGTRYLAAGGLVLAILVAWNRLRGTRWPFLGRRELGWAALTALLLPVLGNGGVVLSLERVPTGVAALVIATEPVLMAVMDAVIDRRAPTPGVIVGVGAGLLGIVVLVAPWQGVPTVDPLGLAICATAAVAWSAGSVLTPRVRWSAAPAAVGGWQMLLGGMILLGLGVAGGESEAAGWSSVSGASVLALGYLVLFGSIVAYSAYSWLLGHARTSLVSTFAFVNPIVAVALGVAILGEPLTPQMLGAASLILVAVVAIVLGQGAPDAHPEASSQRPMKSGSRFSRKAAIPSFWSSEAKSR